MIVLEGRLLQTHSYSPGLRQGRHSHDYANITVVTSGQLFEAADAGSHRAFPFSVVVKPAGCEHETTISGYGARVLSLRIPFDDPLATAIERAGWNWIESPDVVRHAIALQQSVTSGQTPAVRRGVARLIDATTAPPRLAKEPAWVGSVRTAAMRDPARTLSLRAIALDLGLHPTYVSRAFTAHNGSSLRAFVRGARVEASRHLLSGSRQGLAAIAAASGFADASHLCRVFAATLGVTPLQYRRLCRA